MAHSSGMMEFEFDEATGKFIPTGKVLGFIKSALAKGNIEEAVQYYASSDNNDISKQLLEEAKVSSSGMKNAIAEMFTQARDLDKAIEAWELADNPERAAQVAEKDYKFTLAAKYYIKVNNLKKAGECLEKDMNFVKAAELYYKAGDYTRSAKNMERAEKFYQAGELYLKMKNLKSAIRAYQQVPREDENYLNALLKTGKILFAYNQEEMALKTYYRVVSRFPCSPKTLEPYYKIASAYEERGFGDKAIEIYKKILEIDENYKDVAGKLRQLSAGGESVHELAPVEEFIDVEEEKSEKDLTSLRMGFEHVHKFPLFRNLKLDDVRRFYDLSEKIKYKDGEIIIKEGENQPYLFILLKGKFDILKDKGNGEYTFIVSLPAGSAVGELSVITGDVTTASVRTNDNAVVLRIHRDDFFRFLREDTRRITTVYEAVIGELSKRLNDLNKKVAQK